MRRLGRIGISVAVTVGLLLPLVAGLVNVRAAGDPFEAMAVARVAEVAPAPDLAFQTLAGREVRLHELRGKVVLLGFFTTD